MLKFFLLFSFFFPVSYVSIEARRNSNAAAWPIEWKLEKAHGQEKEKKQLTISLAV